jgi:hypothetical protein
MTNTKQPNEVEREVRNSSVAETVQPNAVSKQKMSALLAKKRHMSGMMYPPGGLVPWTREPTAKHD